MIERVQVVDSHTGGEPTRVVVSGGPDLGAGDLAVRRDLFRERFDRFRSAVVNEPRGSDAMVGALLVPPVDPSSAAGVIFFNNVGCLGMCVHGTIGLIVTLAHLGRIGPGRHRLETPVGSVWATLERDGSVRVTNVPSYRTATRVRVQVAGHGEAAGDVAWAGNWFFLTDAGGLELSLAHVERLTEFAWRVRQELVRQGIRGADGGEIDHVELFGPPRAGGHSRNFVLCPGKAYDRSPCGTGTSAKLACLAADGKLAPGERWRQESILGSVFEGTYEPLAASELPATVRAIRDPQGAEIRAVLPTISGTAFVNAEATLLLDDADPFQMGIRP